jgi:dipeptidyl-peptidase-4
VQDLFELDWSTGRERTVLTAEKLLGGGEEVLTAEELARRERTRSTGRGIASYSMSEDGRRLLVPLSGGLYVVDRESGSAVVLPGEGGYPIDAQVSPDGSMVACARNGDLYVIDLSAGTQRRLTTGGGGHVTHGLAEFVAQEEMSRHHGYWWSPDSRLLVYQRTDTSGVERMNISDPSSPEAAPKDWPYPRPGKANADVRLGIISVDGGETRWIEWDRAGFEYLATVRWSRGAPLTLVVQNRRQTEERLLTVDVEHGSTEVIHVERDDAWLDLDQQMPKWRDDGSSFLWVTERNGHKQLEERRRDGTLLRAMTPAGFHFGKLVDIDERREALIVTGHPSPVETQLYRIALGSGAGEPVPMTRALGHHSAAFSDDHEVYRYSADLFDGRRIDEIRSRAGKTLAEMPSVAMEPPCLPRVELTMTDSDPPLHAAIVRPQGFRAWRKYPVIVDVYGGPGYLTVTSNRSSYLMNQWMADHGYIVVSMDGRGTPRRGREWERAAKFDLIGLPLRDQTAGLAALGRQYREMDVDRVGIFGWSFGGYFSAMAVLSEPDVFHVGVAGAPVTDWRDYDTHYTERFMGLPSENEAGYRSTSTMTSAGELNRPLMLIHGTADDNVYFLHSLKLADALNRAGRDYAFLPIPNQTHMIVDPEVATGMYGRVMGFFDAHLK